MPRLAWRRPRLAARRQRRRRRGDGGAAAAPTAPRPVAFATHPDRSERIIMVDLGGSGRLCGAPWFKNRQEATATARSARMMHVRATERHIRYDNDDNNHMPNRHDDRWSWGWARLQHSPRPEHRPPCASQLIELFHLDDLCVFAGPRPQPSRGPAARPGAGCSPASGCYAIARMYVCMYVWSCRQSSSIGCVRARSPGRGLPWLRGLAYGELASV